MAEEAVIRVRLDVAEAKARQKELDDGFRKSTESAGGIGKALFGGLGPLGVGLAGLGAAVVAPAAGGVVEGITSTARQVLGINKYAGRLGAATGAQEELISGLGPAGKYASAQDIQSMFESLLRFKDALADGADRVRDFTKEEVARRSIGPVAGFLDRTINALPDWLFR